MPVRPLVVIKTDCNPQHAKRDGTLNEQIAETPEHVAAFS